VFVCIGRERARRTRTRRTVHTMLTVPVARVVGALIAYAAIRRGVRTSPAADVHPHLGTSDDRHIVSQLYDAISPQISPSDQIWGVLLTRGDQGLTTAQETLLRSFLTARSMEVAGAKEMILSALCWRREFGTDALRAESFALPNELVEIDARGRPVATISFGSLTERAFDDVERFVAWRLCHLEKVMHQLPFNDGVAGCTMVLDCKGMRPFHFGRSARGCLRALSQVCSDFYPDVMHRIVILNAPSFFAYACSLLHPLLPTNFANVVSFSDGSSWERDEAAQVTAVSPVIAEPHVAATRLSTILSALWGRLALWRPQARASSEEQPLAVLLSSLLGWIVCTMRTAIDQAREAFVAAQLTELRPLTV